MKPRDILEQFMTFQFEKGGIDGFWYSREDDVFLRRPR